MSSDEKVRESWDVFWEGATPESEIQMRDFYGGRQWILKHVPRFGRVLEAGCGLGRYVFYLDRLGIDVEGLDFHEPTVDSLKAWARHAGFTAPFRVGDVNALPHEPDSLSGYISLGVIEHIAEGPGRALAEAYRVLRPGGVAVITTPSVSFSQAYLRLRRTARDVVKTVLGKPVKKAPFFQHWYTPRELSGFVRRAGLDVVLAGGGDLVYSMLELGFTPRDRPLFRVVDCLEAGPLARFGAQAFTVSLKRGPRMSCFLCGQQTVRPDRLREFYLPVCRECEATELASYYRPGVKPRFHQHYTFQPPVAPAHDETCRYCGRPFTTDTLFEDFGFAIPVCPACLRLPNVNLDLSNRHLKPVWRMEII
ncbi:MAG: methyltransferase domain-containing protein [Candidatus Eisenbacteria bacterium]